MEASGGLGGCSCVCTGVSSTGWFVWKEIRVLVGLVKVVETGKSGCWDVTVDSPLLDRVVEERKKEGREGDAGRRGVKAAITLARTDQQFHLRVHLLSSSGRRTCIEH